MSKPIVVLHFITRFNAGGTASWLFGLLQGGKATDLRQHLIYGETLSPEFEDPRINQIDAKKINFRKSLSPRNVISGLRELKQEVKLIDPDIVVSHTFHAGLVLRVLSTFSINRRFKVVHTFHGHFLYGYYGWFGRKLYISLERLMSRHTDAFIAPGSKVITELREVGIIKKLQVTAVIPPPIFSRTKIPLEKNWNSVGSLQIGWLARISPVKDIFLLLEIAKHNPEFTFHVGGNQQGEREIPESPQNVIFHGWTSPEDFWSTMDLAILTSQNEGLPISIAEANARGIPAISCDVGSVSDIVIDHRTGFIVERSVDGYSNALRNLDKKTLKLLGGNARRHILNNYSYENCASEHESLFTRLVR